MRRGLTLCAEATVTGGEASGSTRLANLQTMVRPQVIYIMGAGRSGSTVLGIALGNCEGVFYAGELDNWLVRAGMPQLETPERVRFWKEVRDALADPDGATALFGNEAQRAIERSPSLVGVHKWLTRRRLSARYRTVAADLYKAITRVSGTERIVDTSHYPLRARELQRTGGIDLYILFLMRDPRSVVASFGRRDVSQYTKSTLHANVYLWATHLLSLLVFLTHPRERRLHVRYEDFIADPRAILRQILDRVGAPTAELPDPAALAVGVPLQGNRVSRLKTLSLTRPTGDPPRRSRLTAVLQAPLMWVFARLRPRPARM